MDTIEKDDKLVNNGTEDGSKDAIPPKMNVVVSLVNISDDLDSLSPAIRSQFLKISKEILNATSESEPVPADKEEKVYVTMDTDQATDSQSEPLDLSVSHSKSSGDLYERDQHAIRFFTFFSQFYLIL